MFIWTIPQFDSHSNWYSVNHSALHTKKNVSPKNAPCAGASQKKILRRRGFMVLC